MKGMFRMVKGKYKNKKMDIYNINRNFICMLWNS